MERHTHLACFQRHFSTFNKLNQPHNKEQVIKSGRQNSTSSSILMSKSNVAPFTKTFVPYFKIVVGPLFKGLSLHKKSLLWIKMKIQELFHRGSHLSNGQLPRKYTTQLTKSVAMNFKNINKEKAVTGSCFQSSLNTLSSRLSFMWSPEQTRSR